MSDKVRHAGIVDSVEGGCVRVRILQISACASCKVARHCNVSEQKRKIIEVFGAASLASYKKGDKVVVSVSQKVGMYAVMVGFVLPFVVLTAVLFLTWRLTDDETLAAAVGICALLPYYFCVYLGRSRLREKLSFHIEGHEPAANGEHGDENIIIH